MITKGDIVEMALRKLFPAQDDGLTGMAPGEVQKALDDLEAMMGHWQMDSVDLFYNFSDVPDTTPLAQQDSGLELWMKLPVACNLAILIAADYGVEVSVDVRAAAARGWRTFRRLFFKSPALKPAIVLPEGTGNHHLRHGGAYGNSAKRGDKFK